MYIVPYKKIDGALPFLSKSMLPLRYEATLLSPQMESAEHKSRGWGGGHLVLDLGRNFCDSRVGGDSHGSVNMGHKP